MNIILEFGQFNDQFGWAVSWDEGGKRKQKLFPQGSYPTGGSWTAAKEFKATLVHKVAA